MIQKLTWPILLTSLTWTVAARAVDAKVNVAVQLNPVGEFAVTAPAVTGKLKKSGERFVAKELAVPIASLDTGITLRNEHLHKRLGWPDVKTVLVQDVVVENKAGKAQITVNKVTAPLAFTVAEQTDKELRVSFPLRLDDFNIKGVRYLNVGVENEITVEATVPYEN